MRQKLQIVPQDGLAPRNRKVIAIASGKGGVGKTWLAITLSHALAKAGGKVLLFDGDLGLANIDIQLGLLPEVDLAGVIGRQRPLSTAITKYAPGGFDIIAGKSGSGALSVLERGQLLDLRADLLALSKDYEHLVLDLGAGLDSGVTVLSEHGGATLVVVTDEPTSLTDAYAFIKVAVLQNPKAEIQVVVNQAESPAEGERTYGTLLRACENFLKISPPLAGIVRRDRLVPDAIRHQTAFLTRHPNADAADDVAGIAGKLRRVP